MRFLQYYRIGIEKTSRQVFPQFSLVYSLRYFYFFVWEGDCCSTIYYKLRMFSYQKNWQLKWRPGEGILFHAPSELNVDSCFLLEFLKQMLKFSWNLTQYYRPWGVGKKTLGFEKHRMQRNIVFQIEIRKLWNFCCSARNSDSILVLAKDNFFLRLNAP